MFKVYTFTTASKRKPVDEFIDTQPEATQVKISEVIDYFKEYGFHLQTDYLRRISGTKQLWELRVRHQSQQYRIFLAKYGEQAVVLLHAIIKKTAKTPFKDIETAQKRLDQLKKGES